jgi:hypothetical protein
LTITLINKTKRMKTYNLPHETYCKALGRCACTKLPGRGGRSICASLTLPAGGLVYLLFEAVLEVADIIRDLRAGRLEAKREARQAQEREEAATTNAAPRKPKRSTRTQNLGTGGKS